MGIKSGFHAKEHRERSQPEHRQSLGFLERKKDYVARAKDYHEKREAINKLREKARLRNPDEFYFRMLSTKTENGIHQEPAPVSVLSPEQERLAKTQDIAYVRQRIQRDQSRCHKILNLLSCAPPQPDSKKRIVFVDDKADVVKKSSVPAESLLEPSKELIRELEARKARIEKLQQVEQQMKAKEDAASKEAKIVVGKTPNGTPIYKWRAERKK